MARRVLARTDSCHARPGYYAVSSRLVGYFYDRRTASYVLHVGDSVSEAAEFIAAGAPPKRSTGTYCLLTNAMGRDYVYRPPGLRCRLEWASCPLGAWKKISLTGTPLPWAGVAGFPLTPDAARRVRHATVIASDKGRRNHNEDSALYASYGFCAGDGRRRYRLVAVADGAGGLGGGDTASYIVLRGLYRQVGSRLAEGPPTEDAVRELITAVNSELVGYIDRIGRQIASTLSLIIVDLDDGMVYYGNVGDTAIYLLRDGGVEVLNEAHRTVLPGGRTALTSYMGRRRLEQVKVGSFRVDEPVLIAIMTDGVYEYVDPDGLAGRLKGRKALYRLGEAAEELIRQAFARGSSDNLTVALTYLEPPG